MTPVPREARVGIRIGDAPVDHLALGIVGAGQAPGTGGAFLHRHIGPGVATGLAGACIPICQVRGTSASAGSNRARKATARLARETAATRRRRSCIVQSIPLRCVGQTRRAVHNWGTPPPCLDQGLSGKLPPLTTPPPQFCNRARVNRPNGGTDENCVRARSSALNRASKAKSGCQPSARDAGASVRSAHQRSPPSAAK